MKQLLKDIAIVGAGQGAPQGDSNYCDYGIPFVKAGNLQELLEGKAITDIQKVSEEVAEKHRLKLYSKGTILFAKSGMSCMKGYVYVLPQNAYVVSHLACITPKDDTSEYLRYYFKFHKPNQLVKDAAYPSISLADIGNLEIDMKTDSERDKIASQLQHVESVIALREHELQKLDVLVKARFVELFGDPEYNEKCWETHRLNQYLNVIGGYAFKSMLFKKEGIPVLRIGNINAGIFKPVNMVYWVKDSKLKNYEIYPGDLVMSLTGTVEKNDYGNVCILDNSYPMYYLNQRNAKLEIFGELNPAYLAELLKNSFVKKKLTGVSRGVRQANIANKDILSLSVMIPPIELQNQFSDFVKQVDKSKFTEVCI